jgi:hypothetical protein
VHEAQKENRPVWGYAKLKKEIIRFGVRDAQKEIARSRLRGDFPSMRCGFSRPSGPRECHLEDILFCEFGFSELNFWVWVWVWVWVWEYIF